MSVPRTVAAIARADFLERVRRYSFFVTLLFAVYLGYATAKGQITLQLDEYRGVYTSAWIGTLVALVTSCFVSLIGFYIVKNSVERDRLTGVGQILAAAPLAKPAYALGKFLSNLAVLTSMVVVLALGALAMQFLVAEDPVADFWALLAPFLLIALPVMALTAAIAILFEMVPVLRGGVGNVIWFFGWSFGLGLPMLTGLKWLDPAGIFTVMQSLSAEARRYVPGYRGGMAFQINIGQVHVAQNLRWLGLPWNSEQILLRLAWIAVAVLLSLFASVLFDRFADTGSGRGSRGSSNPRKGPLAAGGDAYSTSQGIASALAVPARVHLSPLPQRAPVNAFPRLVAAELRLALQGYRWWWYAVAIGLLIGQLAAPLPVSHGPLLAVAWIWPVLIWSAMGARESRFATRALLFSSARIVFRQLPACFASGFLVSLFTGAGAAIRLFLAGDWSGLFAWLVAAAFLPSLALALGVVTGSSKFFEALYVAWWYVGPLNHIPGLDFTGAAGGSRTLRYAVIYLVLSFALVAAALIVRSRQLRHA
jgi:hypothetical protein